MDGEAGWHRRKGLGTRLEASLEFGVIAVCQCLCTRVIPVYPLLAIVLARVHKYYTLGTSLVRYWFASLCCW